MQHPAISGPEVQQQGTSALYLLAVPTSSNRCWSARELRSAEEKLSLCWKIQAKMREAP